MVGVETGSGDGISTEESLAELGALAESAGAEIAGHVQQRNVGPADQVFEIVEREVPARQDEVRRQSRELVPVERFVHLVGDCEDPQARTSWRATRRSISAARSSSKPPTSPAFNMRAISDAECSRGR